MLALFLSLWKLWQVARWGPSINKLTMLLFYTSHYFTGQTESFVPGSRESLPTAPSLEISEDEVFEDPGSDIHWIPQIWKMGPKAHFLWCTPEAPAHKWMKCCLCRTILHYVLGLCSWLNTLFVPIFPVPLREKSVVFSFTASTELIKWHCLIWLKVQPMDLTGTIWTLENSYVNAWSLRK